MSWFKTAELRDAKEKYGFSHKALFALEDIKHGDSIFACQAETCDYLSDDKFDLGKTRTETEEIFAKHPETKDFIIKYSFMLSDDLFDWPKGYLEQKLSEDCMFFNHSCDPNCAFAECLSSYSSLGHVIALRDIKSGEELTYDYQCMDAEGSHYTGIDCKCGSIKCRGRCLKMFYLLLN